MFEVREVLRLLLRGEGLRRVAVLAGVDRKTVRRNVDTGVGLGLVADGAEDQTDRRSLEARRVTRPPGSDLCSNGITSPSPNAQHDFAHAAAGCDRLPTAVPQPWKYRIDLSGGSKRDAETCGHSA